MGIYNKIKKEHLFIFLVLLTALIIFNYFNFGYSGLVTKRTCYGEGYTCCSIDEGQGFNYFSLDETCPKGMGCYESCRYEDVKNLVTGDINFIDAIVNFFKSLFGKEEVVGEEDTFLLSYKEGHASLTKGYGVDVYGNSIKKVDSGGTVLLKLSDDKNAHVSKADANNGYYELRVKLTNGGNAECSYSDEDGNCDENSGDCLFSISDETNAHIGSCSQFSIQVCCTGGGEVSGECETDDDCSVAKPRCSNGICVECTNNNDCSDNEICENNQCVTQPQQPSEEPIEFYIDDVSIVDVNNPNVNLLENGGFEGGNIYWQNYTVYGTPLVSEINTDPKYKKTGGKSYYIITDYNFVGVHHYVNDGNLTNNGLEIGKIYKYSAYVCVRSGRVALTFWGDDSASTGEWMTFDSDIMQDDNCAGDWIELVNYLKPNQSTGQNGAQNEIVIYSWPGEDFEICDDGYDNNDNNAIDCADDFCKNIKAVYYDNDEAKWQCTSGGSKKELDCDDGLDNDCDGVKDELDNDCEEISECGNGIIDEGEQCDGGNNCTNCVCDSGYQSTTPISIDCEEMPVDIIYPDIDHDPVERAYNGSSLQINATVDELNIKYVRLYSNICGGDKTRTGRFIYDENAFYNCGSMSIIDQENNVYSYTFSEEEITDVYEDTGNFYYYIFGEDESGNKAYHGTDYTTDENDLIPIEVSIVLREDCSSENNNVDKDNAIAALDIDCDFDTNVKISYVNLIGLIDNTDNITYRDSTIDINCGYIVLDSSENILSEYKENAYTCINAKVGDIECSRDLRAGSVAKFIDCDVGNSVKEDVIVECYVGDDCNKGSPSSRYGIINIEEYNYCRDYDEQSEGLISMSELNIGGNYGPGDVIELNPIVDYYLSDNKKLKVSAAIIDIRNDNILMEQSSNEVDTEYGGDYEFSLSLDIPNPVSNGVYKVFVKAYNENEDVCSQQDYIINIYEAECVDDDEDSYCEYEDCDDSDENINPSVMEICDDNIDNDCDDLIDDNDEDCQVVCEEGSTIQCNTGLKGICSEGIKTCINGVYSSCVQVNQATIEQCNDLKDNDCDGKIDCSDSDCSGLDICEGVTDDSDNDGMSDVWELEYFDSLQQGPDADYDGDGVSNFQEFLDNTDPTNKSDYLKKKSYLWLFYVIGIIILIIVIYFVLKNLKPKKKKKFSKEFYKMPSGAVDTRLKNYVKDSLRRGFSKEQIKRALKAKGWKDRDIEDTFR